MTIDMRKLHYLIDNNGKRLTHAELMKKATPSLLEEVKHTLWLRMKSPQLNMAMAKLTVVEQWLAESVSEMSYSGGKTSFAEVVAELLEDHYPIILFLTDVADNSTFINVRNVIRQINWSDRHCNPEMLFELRQLQSVPWLRLFIAGYICSGFDMTRYQGIAKSFRLHTKKLAKETKAAGIRPRIHVLSSLVKEMLDDIEKSEGFFHLVNKDETDTETRLGWFWVEQLPAICEPRIFRNQAVRYFRSKGATEEISSQLLAPNAHFRSKGATEEKPKPKNQVNPVKDTKELQMTAHNVNNSSNSKVNAPLVAIVITPEDGGCSVSVSVGEDISSAMKQELQRTAEKIRVAVQNDKADQEILATLRGMSPVAMQRVKEVGLASFLLKLKNEQP